MCRMLAKVSVLPENLEQETLLAECGLEYLSRQGRQPSDPGTRGPHHDGTGMAWEHEGKIIVEKRTAEHVWDESYQTKIKSTFSRAFIAHNRLASPGLTINPESVHPFLRTVNGQTYAFCHNGAISSFFDEANARGTSDSLLFFEQLVREGHENSPAEILQRLAALEASVQYKSMTAMLLAPGFMLCWRLYNERSLSQKALYEDYYTLYLNHNNQRTVIASEPLNADSGWTKLPNKTVYTFRYAQPQIEIIKAELLC